MERKKRPYVQYLMKHVLIKRNAIIAFKYSIPAFIGAFITRFGTGMGNFSWILFIAPIIYFFTVLSFFPMLILSQAIKMKEAMMISGLFLCGSSGTVLILSLFALPSKLFHLIIPGSINAIIFTISWFSLKKNLSDDWKDISYAMLSSMGLIFASSFISWYGSPQSWITMVSGFLVAISYFQWKKQELNSISMLSLVASLIIMVFHLFVPGSTWTFLLFFIILVAFIMILLFLPKFRPSIKMKLNKYKLIKIIFALEMISVLIIYG